jgi:hypothetical protein
LPAVVDRGTVRRSKVDEVKDIRFRPKRCHSLATLLEPFNIYSAAFAGGTVLTATFSGNDYGE